MAAMPRTQLSRTPLSKQAGLLRHSLMLSLGLSPLACGGSAAIGSNADGGASAQAGAAAQAGAGDSAGASSLGGAASLGGAPSDGGAFAHGGTSSHGGAPSHAGTSSYGGAPTAGAGPSGGSGGTSSVDACPNPVFNSVTKLIDCANGRKHRAESLTCTLFVPPGAGGASGVAGAGGNAGAAGAFNYCTTKADCAALPYGYCESGGNASPTCRAGCSKDSDCATGICACNGIEPGRCVSAGCSTDADCGPNSLCAPVDGLCGPGSFECTTPQDECATRADCRTGACTFDGTHRVCNTAVCGRPFLIAESPRLAAIDTRADWLDATLSPNPSELSPVQ